MSFIFKITCVPTGEFLIGSTKELLGWRERYLGILRRGTGPALLQAAANRHGLDALTFAVIRRVVAGDPEAELQRSIRRNRPALNTPPPSERGCGSAYARAQAANERYAARESRKRVRQAEHDAAEVRRRVQQVLREKPIDRRVNYRMVASSVEREALVGDVWGWVKVDCLFAVEERRIAAMMRRGAVLDLSGRGAAAGEQPAFARVYDVGDGVTMTAAQIAEVTGLGRAGVYRRVAQGVTGEALLEAKRRAS